MSNNKHLTLDDRTSIEVALKEKSNFTTIAKSLGKDPSTISKEIRSHLSFQRIGGFRLNYNACAHRFSCDKHHICSVCHADRRYKRCKSCSMCNAFCKNFEPVTCKKLLKPPYCCNGCGKRHSECSLEKRLYIAKSAHDEYLKTLSESRTGIAFSEDEISYIDSLVSPLIKKGQSPHHICVTNKDSIMLSERTLYRLIDSCLISARNIDLPRKVRFSVRKNPVHVKVDKSCRIGRTYDSFLTFMDEHPDVPVVQLDSVEGKKGGKVLLTIHFTKAEMMLAFLREHNDSKSVIDVFNFLFDLLGSDLFMQIFKVCLTDNGSEFSNPRAIEFDVENNRRTYVFYCDPSAPYQKGSAERNHEFIRHFLPKGTDFEPYSQDDISLMMNHINSYCRESLGNKSPYDMFAFLYGEKILDLLKCQRIPPQDVTLNKSIFHKEVQS